MSEALNVLRLPQEVHKDQHRNESVFPPCSGSHRRLGAVKGRRRGVLPGGGPLPLGDSG